MNLRFFTKIQGLDYKTSKFQEYVDIFVRQLYSVNFLKGVLLENVAVGTTDTEISHKLGVVPKGWLIFDQDADARVWRSADFDINNLTLRASSAVNVTIWVF